MDCEDACTFLFIGAVIAPAALLLSGEPSLAAIAQLALLVAGGLCSLGDPEAPHRRRPPGKVP
jgi:hypothetical protein